MAGHSSMAPAVTPGIRGAQRLRPLRRARRTTTLYDGMTPPPLWGLTLRVMCRRPGVRRRPLSHVTPSGFVSSSCHFLEALQHTRPGTRPYGASESSSVLVTAPCQLTPVEFEMINTPACTEQTLRVGQR